VPAILIIVVAALVAAVPGFADPVAAKKAEAQQVLAQINQLNISLGKAVEAYDAATVKLDHIRHDLSVNKYEMRVAKTNLKGAVKRLDKRLRELYMTSDDTNSTVGVLLGSKNLDEVINRLETANRVSDQDAQILEQVTKFKHQVAIDGAALERAHRAQQRVVADRAAAKQRIQDGIAEHQRLVASIRGEIQRLQAEEAAQQALLAAQARARLVQQQQVQQARLNTAVVGATAQAPASTGDPNAVTTVAPPSRYGGVVGVAMAQLGKPYVYGTAGPDTFDCSGLVVYSYAAMGVSLPHSSYALWNVGVYVSSDQLEPGDILFFDGLGHVGIYIGGGQFIQAPHTGDVVKISSMSDSWYAANYVGARRVL
jgi:peptidoglycan DL-endopeptidase CwlO